ncbi:RIB1 [Candida oxycetoniae]|uniref:GTP cyclohydrolase II n=1 Tax=Candida oxycetoniae TaxID=497107 RepID=A0AAI9SYA3_9ASCO|nr:RIB1 [Candida oxycetoniae]KAI3404840.1 RIB1 [Candida oxycetoniae]
MATNIDVGLVAGTAHNIPFNKVSSYKSQGDLRSKEYTQLHSGLNPVHSLPLNNQKKNKKTFNQLDTTDMSLLHHPQPSSTVKQNDNSDKSNGAGPAPHYLRDVSKIPIVTPRPSSAMLPLSNGQQVGSPQLPPVITQDMRDQTNLPDELPQVNCIARARIPTTQGPDIFLHLYENNIDSKEHLAIVFGEDIRSRSLFKQRPGETQQDRMTRGAYVGELYPGRTTADSDNTRTLHFTPEGDLIIDDLTFAEPTLVRIHSECYTGETAWSARCDCGEQFDQAGKIMGENGHGCMVYLRQEGRGIGLGEKLKAYNLQDLGADTVEANLMLRHPADARNFSLATAILLDLGLVEIKLLTNNPDKIIAVEGKHQEVTVSERIPMIPLSWSHSHENGSNGVSKKGINSKEIEGYLSTKIERMGHLLEKPIKIGNQ